MSAQHGSMPGMSSAMDITPAEPRRARAFDRAFIDAMMPHHEEAIRMARSELRDGRDPELREISRSIIATQSREIRQLRRWRERWYGRD